MTHGKRTCKILKEIRQQIAEKNDIEYVTSECHFQGECKGTCPKCEAELQYLEKELSKRRQLGKAVAVAGIATISLGIAGTFSACNFPKQEITANIDTIPLVVQIDWKSLPATGFVFDNSDTTITNDERYIWVYVDSVPEYPGGDEALIKFFRENIVYPEEIKEKKIEVLFYLSFIVEKNGSVTDVEVRRGDPALYEEIERIIKLTKWKPAEKNGKIVRTEHRMPLTVTLLNDEERIWDIVDVYPEYPGGEKARLKFLKKNIIYPKDAKEKGIEEQGSLEFIVEKDGSLSNFSRWWDLDPVFEAEAIRVGKMMPKWEPGKLNGKAVRTRYRMPLTFKLED